MCFPIVLSGAAWVNCRKQQHNTKITAHAVECVNGYEIIWICRLTLLPGEGLACELFERFDVLFSRAFDDRCGQRGWCTFLVPFSGG